MESDVPEVRPSPIQGGAATSKDVSKSMKKLKFIDGCQVCEGGRMEPVKAWAVIRDGFLQGHAADNGSVHLVLPTKAQAKKYKYLAGDRIAKVEIREIF